MNPFIANLLVKVGLYAVDKLVDEVTNHFTEDKVEQIEKDFNVSPEDRTVRKARRAKRRAKRQK